MFSLVNRHRITETVFANKLISRNRNQLYYQKLISHDPNRNCYRKPMPTIHRQMIKVKLTILSLCYNIPALPFFSTVVLLKLSQYRPPDLRWATIVVVMQITAVKAKRKLQQYFACYQLAHYLVANY